jgi:hypothetical protein
MGKFPFAMALALMIVTGAHPSQDPKVESVRVDKAPVTDGKGDDEAWAAAKALEVRAKRVMPPNLDSATTVSIRSVHTGTHLHFLIKWKDETKDDVAHKPWAWDAAKNAYVEGSEREDMFSIAFEHTGTFDADMLSGVEAVWDVWHWKATRTNPQGFAMDRSHRYTRAKPEGKAKEFKAKDGSTIWIARPEDGGDTVEKKQPAPKERAGDRVPQYLPGSPSGSAADVRAKGAWADGWWTLELERKLDTGNKDDTAFDTKREYRFAVGTHDRTGDMDKASGVIILHFE